jgi:hypothetical protein
MSTSPLVFFHIWAALIGIAFGSAALFLRKGSRLHRLTGNVFFVSMLIMSLSAATMAAFVKPVMVNAVAGVLTFYMVATAWLTVVRKPGETGLLEIGLLIIILADGAGAVVFGREAAHSATGLKDGASSVGYFIFAFVAFFCAVFDVRMLIRGGVAGVQRVARHLSRMTFALLFATTSLFLGQQQMFPVGIRKTHLLVVPPIIIAVVMLFWVFRVRFPGVYARVQGQLTRRSRDAAVNVQHAATAKVP